MEEAIPNFVSDIPYNHLNILEVVGRGAFGTVYKATYQETLVAVKVIESENEVKAFLTEVRQLSRVSHPNIVQLYGACREKPVCLIMEFAEGGSLYNVLHGSEPRPVYTSAHAMSWCLQCAGGVAYLHGMKPKALIHRDLKPPNLLLIAGGTVLKICDFGTACDIQTYMTNNKGSAAWMAPEVFEGSKYSEKCDVFSWGIILWEVLTRQKPFDEIGGPAFRIMWAVHNGTRPPPIRGCPKPLEILMTRCWDSDAAQRPSMEEVVNIMTHLIQFFPGSEEPIIYPGDVDAIEEALEEPEGSSDNSNSPSTITSTLHFHGQQKVTPTSSPSGSGWGTTITSTGHSVPGSEQGTIKTKIIHGEPVIVNIMTPRRNPPVVMETDRGSLPPSAPASLANSRENLCGAGGSRASTPSIELKRRSADLTTLRELERLASGQNWLPGGLQTPIRSYPVHQAVSAPNLRISTETLNILTGKKPLTPDRSGGYYDHAGAPPPLPPKPSTPLPSPCRDPSASTTPVSPFQAATPVSHFQPIPVSLMSPVASPQRQYPTSHPSSHPTSLPLSNTNRVGNKLISPNSTCIAPIQACTSKSGTPTSPDQPRQEFCFPTLDHQLRPLQPAPESEESMGIFHRHCQMAQEYLRVQAEIQLLIKRKLEINEELEKEVRDKEESNKNVEEFKKLTSENESLMMWKDNLLKKLEDMKRQKQRSFLLQQPQQQLMAPTIRGHLSEGPKPTSPPAS